MSDDILEITAHELLGDLTKMSDAEQFAREFAIKAHGDQKYGDESYVTHLAAVRETLIEFGCAERAHLIGAWLHDTVEDTSVTRETIEANFGHVVASYVWAVTGVGKNRAERNRNAYAKMKRLPEAILIKLADRITNMRNAKATKPDLFTMYVREYPTFRSELRPITESADVVCSRAMWRALDRLVEDTPPTPWPGAPPNKRNDEP